MAQPAEQAVRVIFAAPAGMVLGEPVIAQLTVGNGLSEPIEFDLGSHRKTNLRIRVTGPDGTSQDLPQYFASGFGETGKEALAPSRTFTQQYVLNEWKKDFTQVGSYRVQMSLDSPFRTKSGTSLSPQTSGLVEFRIQARDQTRLRDTCERFAELAIRSESAETVLNAGRVLRYFLDPAVVPCLQRVVRATPQVDSFVVAALIEIGTVESQDVLLEMFRTTNDPLRLEVTNNALSRFRLRATQER